MADNNLERLIGAREGQPGQIVILGPELFEVYRGKLTPVLPDNLPPHEACLQKYMKENTTDFVEVSGDEVDDLISFLQGGHDEIRHLFTDNRP